MVYAGVLVTAIVSLICAVWYVIRRRPWSFEDESLAMMQSPAALIERGKAHIRTGDYRRAASAFRYVLSLNLTESDWQVTATAHYHLGLVAQYQSNWSLAIFHYSAARTIYEDFADQAGIAAQYCNLGVVYFRQGDLNRSRELHEKSLKIMDGLGDDLGMASNYSGIGSILREQQDDEGARAMHQRALDIFEQYGRSESIANQLTALANDARCAGDTDRALQLFQQSRQLFLELDMQHRAKPVQKMIDYIQARRSQAQQRC